MDKPIFLIDGTCQSWSNLNDLQNSIKYTEKSIRYMKSQDYAAVVSVTQLLNKTYLQKLSLNEIALYTSVGHQSYFPELFWDNKDFNTNNFPGSYWFSCMYSPIFFLSRKLKTMNLGMVTGPTALDTVNMLKRAMIDIRGGKYKIALLVAVCDFSNPAGLSELKRLDLDLAPFISCASILISSSKFELGLNKEILSPSVFLENHSSFEYQLNNTGLIRNDYPLELLLNANKQEKMVMTVRLSKDNNRVKREIRTEMVMSADDKS